MFFFNNQKVVRLKRSVKFFIAASTKGKTFFFHSLFFSWKITRHYLLDLTGEDKYVVFISGLSVGRSSSNPLQFQLFVDHITGHLGDEKVQQYSMLYFFLEISTEYMTIYLIFCYPVNVPLEKEQNIAAQIVQVVIAGNSVEVPHGLLNGQVLIFSFVLVVNLQRRNFCSPMPELLTFEIFLFFFCWSNTPINIE